MSIWGNTLVDGHNRYEIVQEHPEISFSTMPLPFESREEVLAWICKNQLGRRNLTPEQKYYLMGKQYEAEKAAHGGDRKSTAGAFIAPLRCANAVPPQTLLRTDEAELCQFDTIPPTIEKTERSRRGTPCCTYRYRLWSFAGCVLFRGAPCFLFCP